MKRNNRLRLFLLGSAYALISLSACTDGELMDMKQISHGAQLYKIHCANCHQENGEGLAKLIPPLKGSDYLSNEGKSLPCIVQYGLKGNILVNGTLYNLGMPANKALSKEEITDICLYVLQKFPETPIQATAAEIEKNMANCDF